MGNRGLVRKDLGLPLGWVERYGGVIVCGPVWWTPDPDGVSCVTSVAVLVESGRP